MERNKTNFRESLAFGENGEKLVANFLISCGFSVLPLYQFNADSAPMVIGSKTDFVSPDLTLFKKGKTTFVEVKSKTRWVSNNGRLETGCDYRHYLNYKRLSNETGLSLWIIFNHLDSEPVGLYAIDVNQNGRYWDGKTPKGKLVHKPMYFWPKNKLIEINSARSA